MISDTIHITTDDGVAEAYVTRPDEGDHPAVLLHMDAIGLRPRIEDMADRIAGWGYLVMAPNLFYRDGTAAELQPSEDLTVAAHREAFFAGAMARVGAMTPDVAARDSAAYVQTIAALPGVSGPGVGVTGYCMGGALAVRAAAQHPDTIVAIGSFHGGRLATEAPDSPHRLLDGLHAELYFAHADHDHSMPAEAIAELGGALDAAGLTYTSEVYEGASHGFTMADSPPYDEQAAERHFRELEALLGRTLR